MYVPQCFHSHGQQPCKSIEWREGFYIRIRFNTHRNRLGLHQHDRCFVVIGGREVMWKLSTSEAWSCHATAWRVFPCNSINLRYDNRPYPYHLLSSRKNQDMCDHENWRNWRIFRLVRIMGKTVSFFDIECSVTDKFRYTLFYKNIFYKNIEAEICEILRIF